MSFLNIIVPMRWAKSYSIIDHKLLHGKYLHRLSHNSMVLYLFLAVVSNSNGKNYYAKETVSKILRIPIDMLEYASHELIQEGLIDYEKPYWYIKNIT